MPPVMKASGESIVIQYLSLYSSSYFSFLLKMNQVQLGDGDVKVSKHCWETACAQTTAKGMARTLLQGLFSLEVLLQSNLTGGVNKVQLLMNTS